MNKIFSDTAWNDILSWQDQDKKTLKKIIQLIKDIERNGHNSIGQTEVLKGSLSGFYSKYIDKKNRLVYKILENNDLYILSCKGHYNDK